MVATSLGLMAHHAFGCWHGDRRLADKYGEAFEKVGAAAASAAGMLHVSVLLETGLMCQLRCWLRGLLSAGGACCAGCICGLGRWVCLFGVRAGSGRLLAGPAHALLTHCPHYQALAVCHYPVH